MPCCLFPASDMEAGMEGFSQSGLLSPAPLLTYSAGGQTFLIKGQMINT